MANFALLLLHIHKYGISPHKFDSPFKARENGWKKGVFCSDLAHSTLSPFFVHRGEETELGNEKSGVVVLLKSQPRERELLGHSNAGHKYKLGELHILSFGQTVGLDDHCRSLLSER